MDNITIGQIVSACGSITAIAVFLIAIFKWYKLNIADKFDKIEERLNFVEEKRDEYEREVQNSKEERMILLRGELAALKGLKEKLDCNGPVTHSIEEIEEYMVKKTHD